MNNSMITIINYGYGNIFSTVSAFNKLGFRCKVSDNKIDILNSSIVVLPGVGSFNQAMKALKKKKLDSIIKTSVINNKSIIGICLGYQMLFSKSSEFGNHEGLNIVEGEVRPLSLFNRGLFKIPNVGWRPLIINAKNGSIKNKYNNSMMYFVHSYVPQAKNEMEVSSFIKFNETLIHTSLHYKNIVGFQFHPEKSGEIGLRLLKDSIKYLLDRI